MAKSEHFKFEAFLARKESGIRFYYIQFPFNVLNEFGKKGTVRVHGIYNGIEAERALIPDGSGNHYIIFGGDLRKKMHLSLGDVVQAEIWLNTAPNKITIPEELLAVFELEPITKQRFNEKLNNSTKRNICYWISSAKREETRTKRALEMMNRLLKDEFEMGGKTTRMQ